MDESFFYRVTVSPDQQLQYDLSGDLSALTWEQRSNSPDRLTVQVPDPFKVMGHALQEGMYVELELGTDALHPLVFRGIIYTVESSFPGAGVPLVTIKAFDSLKQLGMRRHSPPAWDDDPLSEIVKAVVTASGVEFADVAAAPSSDPRVREVQIDMTDLDYLIHLCGAYGCLMHVDPEIDGDVFTFTDSATIMALEPALILSYGRSGAPNNLLEFNATVDAERLEVPHVLSGTDRKTGKPIPPVTRVPIPPGKVDDPFMGENLAAIADSSKRALLDELIKAAPAAADTVKQLRLAGAPAVAGPAAQVLTTREELELNADNWYSVNAFGMSGTGTTAGTPELRAHSTVQLDDVGGRFSGTWFLTEVRHIVGRDGYHTEFSCKR